jgi:hypothetical protein
MTAVGPRTWSRRHLLDVDGFSRDELETILALAVDMRNVRAGREHPSLLEAETVALAFFEASTRTRVSFGLAARALGADVIDLSAPASSVTKGESLVDTLRTLERTGIETVVLRHASSGAPHLAAARRQVLADMVGTDRQLAMAPVDEHRQPDGARASVVGQGIERGAHRASGVEDIVDEDDGLAVHRGPDLAALDDRRVRQPGEIVAVEGDVE